MRCVDKKLVAMEMCREGKFSDDGITLPSDEVNHLRATIEVNRLMYCDDLRQSHTRSHIGKLLCSIVKFQLTAQACYGARGAAAIVKGNTPLRCPFCWLLDAVCACVRVCVRVCACVCVRM